MSDRPVLVGVSQHACMQSAVGVFILLLDAVVILTSSPGQPTPAALCQLANEGLHRSITSHATLTHPKWLS